MAVSIQNLLAESASTSTPKSFAPGTGKVAIIRNIRLVNIGTEATVSVTFKGMNILPVGLKIPANGLVLDADEITAKETDTLQVSVSAGGPVHCVISGVLRDLS